MNEHTSQRAANGGADESHAHEVLDRSLIEIVYQPIVHVRDGHVVAYEALCRTSSPHYSSIRELIDGVAGVGRIGELGRRLRQLAVRGCPDQAITVNVEPREFDEGWLVRPDDAIFLHRGGVFLEVTESVPLEYFAQCLAILDELRKRGIRLVIDDLGAGYSNLKYIADLRPDIVKLDRKLLAGIRLASRGYRLLRSIVRLVHEMEAEVVAEGIETAEELHCAREAGVDYGQGFFLAQPGSPPPKVPWPIF